MTKDEMDLTIQTLRECIVYDPVTGGLTWLWRPREHFDSDRAWWQRNGLAGKPAGSMTDTGYVKVRIKVLDRVFSLRGHRVGWALTHGRWPEHEIDHENRKRADNRLVNLREATHAEQGQNTAGRRRGGPILPTGVRAQGKGFSALISVNRRQTYLGTFGTPEEARDAYLRAKEELHPFHPRAPA